MVTESGTSGLYLSITIMPSLTFITLIMSHKIAMLKLLPCCTITRLAGLTLIIVPNPVGITGNSVADSAAKYALDGEVLAEYIPFSDLKPLNNCVSELRQNEWDNYLLHKLHKISPNINDFPTCHSN